MRALVVTDTAVQLPNVAPFMPSYTVVVLNMTGTEEILQSSDAQAGQYTTLATVPAGAAAEVTLDNAWVKLASAGTMVLLGN